MTALASLITEARTHRPSPGHEVDTDMIRRLADALESAEVMSTPTDDELFDALDQHLPDDGAEYCACGATWGATHLVAVLTGDTTEFGVYQPGPIRRAPALSPRRQPSDAQLRAWHLLDELCRESKGLPLMGELRSVLDELAELRADMLAGTSPADDGPSMCNMPRHNNEKG